jgi:hypothetical protein
LHRGGAESELTCTRHERTAETTDTTPLRSSGVMSACWITPSNSARVSLGVTQCCVAGGPPPCHSDQNVANREIRVWHFVIENGY